MFKVKQKLNECKIDNTPKNLDKMELKLWKMGYRLFGEKIADEKVSNKFFRKVKIKSYFMGKKCIKVKDILEDRMRYT